MNTIQTNKWLTYSYKLPNRLLTEEQINNAITDFKNTVLSELSDNQYLLIIFKIKTSDRLTRSISVVQRINKCTEIHEIFNEYWNLKIDNYMQFSIQEIIFNYFIIDKKYKISKPIITKPSTKIDIRPNLLHVGSYNFPQTMDITEWGKVDFILQDTEAIVYKKYSNSKYHIKFNKHKMLVKYVLNNKTLITFTDELLDVSNLATFKRTIKNQTFHFIDGNLHFKEKVYTFPFIKKISPRPFLINKTITMDIETRNIDGIISPYAVSTYDGCKLNFFYLSDYENTNELLVIAIQSLMQIKYNGYKVYLHNFSNFDGVFLLNILIKLSDKIDPIINDGKLIDITFKFNDGKSKLYFRDSLLMLPASLRKLAKSFNVMDKGIFPYRFADTVNLDYIGPVPDYKYFDGISECKYKQYANDFTGKLWNLRRETEWYCNQDCLVLYEVLDAFFKENFDNTRVNPSKYVSLPSLAFANFRCEFMSEDSNIPKLKGEVYHFIKKGYCGGAVDVYKPYANKVYRYDVNSLYPYVMRNYKMPVGNPTLIEGDHYSIEQIILDESKFSFVEVDVVCPDTVKAPLLLHKFNNKTIAPVGRWHGVYTSIEILRAIELGYTFKYIKGVYFNSKIIFKDYVDFYYNIKKNSDKNSSKYTNSKLMLNSLYGKFGTSPYLYQHAILSKEEVIKLSENAIIKDILPLSIDKELISYLSNEEDDFEDTNSLSSISIAAAITACARVYMSYFKNMEGFIIYYSDTDSIDIDRPLDPIYVGKDLGQLKLEYVFDEAVYLAPKMYGGINTDSELVRVKGLKNPIKFEQLKTLLKKGSSLTYPNQKWYKNLSKGNILIRDEIYTLSITESKRQLIFDSNNTFIDTRPIKI